MPLVDALGRTITYLRVSVTDRCNLRCQYCMPAEGVPGQRHDDILRYEEIERIVRAAAGLGVWKVRLTGGEPLVRKDLPSLVRLLRDVPGVREITMTTNATLLDRHAQELADAGLDRVNVSLDTLDPTQYAAITRCGNVEDALRGLEAAEAAGLTPIKVNSVVARGMNDGALVDLARLTLKRPWSVRFIEWMPLNGDAAQCAEGFIPAAETRATLERSLGPLSPVEDTRAERGLGPAVYYRLPGAAGTIGFISAVSQHFCAACNRLRLTADGRLRLCLLADDEVDLRALVRAGADQAAIQRALQRAVAAKPAGHHLADHVAPAGRHMSEIGG